MHNFKLNKLIRDKIFIAMKEDEFILDKQDLSAEEYIKALKDKLIEESHEVMEANTALDLIDEIADVMEVINSILKAKNISIDDIKKRQLAKKEERGGFDGRFKVNSITLDEHNKKHDKWISYFMQQPSKYPLTVE